ncbi:Gustatory receptor 29 [Cephus cinctus]|uniref:Gustatory receptor n=1 Tax=Cephus cinctus TaxID=211228 RepID=A0A3L9LSW8_CEPCN|nr:uncharacterized protein LOC107270003 [Cephus cinctus]RLZ02224.1 Gustatory receptor 29 [Cephus cinctus]
MNAVIKDPSPSPGHTDTMVLVTSIEGVEYFHPDLRRPSQEAISSKDTYMSTSKMEITVYEEFSPVTLISRAIGVFPFRLQRIAGRQAFVTSRGASIYLLLLLGFNLTHLISIPVVAVMTTTTAPWKNNSIEDNHRRIHASSVIRLIYPMGISFMAITSRINSLAGIKKLLPDVFTRMNDVDQLLKRKSHDLRISSRNIWIFVVLNLVLGLPSQIFSVTFVYGRGTYLVGFFIFMDNFNNLTALSSEFQFLALCHLIRSRFWVINTKMLHAARLYDARRRSQNGSAPGHELECCPWKMTGYQFEPDPYSDHRLRDTMVVLRDAHQRLCDTLDWMNEGFQVQVLFSVCGCFLNLLVNIYFLLRGGYSVRALTEIWPFESLGNIHPLKNTSWGIYYIIRFVAIAVMASRTTSEAKKTLVHVLRMRSTSRGYATKEELTLFHDHINSRRMKFSAAGFFDLNVSMISSAVATGATYLVIMVQFLNK